VLGRLQRRHGRGLPFEDTDRAHALGAEQFEAAHVDPGECDNGMIGVHLDASALARTGAAPNAPAERRPTGHSARDW
jgi:hypothetical protein